ncbi:hypothetical protein QE389_002125 [Brevundimonas sp. SORGH_AS 993]|nr:hypothetical protein [Brevundimonas sp. SORGH_AS_0993]
MPAAVRRGHAGVERGQGVHRQRAGAAVVQHTMRRRQGEQDEGQVVEIRRVVHDGARVVRRRDPKIVVTAIVGDQSVQAPFSDRAAGRPAQGRRFAKDIDLARLDAGAAGAARDRPALEIQLLVEATLIVQAVFGPQRQSLVEQPDPNPVFGGGKRRHGLGLRR